MAIGVPETDVYQAADRVLARAERPTVERVRAELGRGSPARVGQLLEQWWDRLAKRLAGESLLPDLPADVAAAFKTVWTVASEQAMTTAQQQLVNARQALEQEKATLAAERSQWSVDLERARANTADAKDAQAVSEQRLADHQRLVEQLQIELRDVKAQRDKLREQADILVQDMMRLGAKLEKREKDHVAERTSTAAHVRTVEDRAHAEVDRARAEIKVLRTLHTQAERAGQAARDAAAREYKEHAAELRTAEREASAQRARAEALESQLKRLGGQISQSKSRRKPPTSRGKA
jgi:chromosome segregation ATPase